MLDFIQMNTNTWVPLFITIEIYQNRLTQAYHRFNHDCIPEEAEWILDY